MKERNTRMKLALLLNFGFSNNINNHNYKHLFGGRLLMFFNVFQTFDN